MEMSVYEAVHHRLDHSKIITAHYVDNASGVRRSLR